MSPEQYLMLCARRQAFDNFVWQTPALAMAAQAFLLAASFNPETPRSSAIILAMFSGSVGLASFQLMMKHRYFETRDSHLLAEYEAAHLAEGFSILHGEPERPVNLSFPLRFSSYRIWLGVLSGFCLLAIYGVVRALFSN